MKYVDPSNPFYPLQIQTTLDYDIQVKAEELVERHQIKKGGLILLDIESNSILASVSRPQMDMSNPFYNDGAKNMMLTAHIPGSVFKTVIAAAAIEHQIVSGDRLFDCHLTIHGEVDEQFNHGRLNFMNSFAASCNQTFATLAQELSELDPNIIETYAKKLGIIDLVGWEGDVFQFEKFRQLSDEETGSVFLRDEERHDKKLIRQTGIGQQSVRITPLSAANMMATIARGGDKQMVRAVASIKYKNGTDLYKFHRKPLKGETISSYTASKLQQMLHEVVKMT